MNVAVDLNKKIYKYDNRVQAVCKPAIKNAIEAEAKQTGASVSEIAARILETHYKSQQRQSKNVY